MSGVSESILREVHKLVKLPSGSFPSDQELLRRFSEYQDEAAFAELVRRHGSLVLGVCRRVLGRVQDAEDAFKATSLLLLRKAASVQKQESVASWLFGVAQRVAANAKIAAARRSRHETNAAVSNTQEAQNDVTW